MAVSAADKASGDVDLLDPDGVIGRDADIAWVVSRIERGEPLVVVSGPAGAGKTSLATRVARIVDQPGRYVIGPTNLHSALRSVAASRPRPDAAAGAMNAQGASGPVGEALQAAQADVRTDTSLVVLIDDYESSPMTEELLSKLLVRTTDSSSQQTIVVMTREAEAPFGAAIHRIEPLPVEVLVDHLARVGQLLDPPASPKERAAWASQLSSDMSLAADLFRALSAVRLDQHDTGVR